VGATYWLSVQPPPVEQPAPPPQFLSTGAPASPKPFRFSDVPGWLFVHVGIIAALQVLSLIAAVFEAGKVRRRRDARTVQFLVEVPMYLGLFGTLLGVCLTQVVTGALTAPLAYLTTMTGILLHVFGKLTILLPLPDATADSD
jgi:ABC-type Fe3+ transport system permease subunit